MLAALCPLHLSFTSKAVLVNELKVVTSALVPEGIVIIAVPAYVNAVTQHSLFVALLANWSSDTCSQGRSHRSQFGCCCAEGDDELNEEPAGVGLPLADAPAAVIPIATVAAACACIDRVLQAVHRNLSRLLTEDNLQLHLLEVARHHLAGKDEAAELQVQLPEHGCSC